MTEAEKKKYYYKLNKYDIALEETNHKYIMIHEWAKDSTHKWGIAVYQYDDDSGYWYLRTYDNINKKDNDWIALGTLIELGFKWIKELGWDD